MKNQDCCKKDKKTDGCCGGKDGKCCHKDNEDE